MLLYVQSRSQAVKSIRTSGVKHIRLIICKNNEKRAFVNGYESGAAKIGENMKNL